MNYCKGTKIRQDPDDIKSNFSARFCYNIGPMVSVKKKAKYKKFLNDADDNGCKVMKVSHLGQMT